MWLSTSIIFSILEGSMSGDVTRFSTANTTPSDVCMPIAVDPSCSKEHCVNTRFVFLQTFLMHQYVKMWLRSTETTSL